MTNSPVSLRFASISTQNTHMLWRRSKTPRQRTDRGYRNIHQQVDMYVFHRVKFATSSTEVTNSGRLARTAGASLPFGLPFMILAPPPDHPAGEYKVGPVNSWPNRTAFGPHTASTPTDLAKTPENSRHGGSSAHAPGTRLGGIWVMFRPKQNFKKPKTSSQLFEPSVSNDARKKA